MIDDESPNESRTIVARGRDAEDLEDEVLLLAALGVPYELVDEDGGAVLVVDVAHVATAQRELAALREKATYDSEPALRGGSRAGIPTAAALLVGHLVLYFMPPVGRAAIYAAGELDAVRVRHGELERIVTALCLHSDLAHVFGNAMATAIFVSAAGDWIGPGLALLLTVLSGALGNSLAALLDPGHRAIGFSTATFGALGLTVVFGFVARFRDRLGRKRAWLALGSGVALLALLGAGERSDLLAHMLGLVAGAGFGLAVARTTRAAHDSFLLRPIAQLASVALVFVGVIGAWLVALAR